MVVILCVHSQWSRFLSNRACPQSALSSPPPDIQTAERRQAPPEHRNDPLCFTDWRASFWEEPPSDIQASLSFMFYIYIISQTNPYVKTRHGSVDRMGAGGLRRSCLQVQELSLLSNHPNVRAHHECFGWHWVKCGHNRSEVGCLRWFTTAYILCRTSRASYSRGISAPEKNIPSSCGGARWNKTKSQCWIQHDKI